MRRLAIVLMAISVSIGPRIGRAQSPSLSARLHASVEIDSRDVFVYRYTIENGAGSTAAIWKMIVDISVPTGASRPTATGLALGLAAPQPEWRTTVGTDATARWVAVKDTSFVFPKQRLAGFSLASHGPPSLRRFTLVPHIDPDRAPVVAPGDDPGEADRYQQEFDQYVESQSVAGITLAPAAPVAMTPEALLANLASQLGQARSLRWISSDAITRNLTERLHAGRAAILRRQLETSGNILRSLRNDVATQSGKSLTSEAATLVDLNIQYTLRLLAKP